VKATTILNTLLTDVTPTMHKKRRQCLSTMVQSLMSGASLSVTSLGRHIHSQTTEKHQIKRSTRLCSNHHLQTERTGIYASLCRRLVGNQKQPIILVDWSDLDPRKQHFLLRAAIAIQGRSVTLMEEVYPLSQKEKPIVHKEFMSRLKASLPVGCKPIIVTDAGFRVPWFKLIESLGWDYVGRVRNRTFCKNESDSDWHGVKDLYAKTSVKPKSLGAYQLCRRASICCHMVVFKQKHKGRKHLTATGDRARISSHSRSNAHREKEPWLLATSLAERSSTFAKTIVKIYQTRMQIEESFRDLKTGLNFNESNTRKHKRLSVLLLLAMLGQFVLFLLGMTVTLAGKHRRYQANSVKTEPVLSYQFIGLRAFKDTTLKLRQCDWRAAHLNIQQLIAEPLNV